MALATAVSEPLSQIRIVGAGMGSVPFSFLSVPMECTISTTFWGTRSELREVIALAEAGRISVHSETFPLDDTAKAYERLEAGQIEGRAIVRP